MPLRNWQEMMDEAAKAGPLEFKPLDPGEYDLIIEKAEHRTSQGGKDGYNITTRVETGPHANAKVFNTFWISPESPQAMSIFFRQMNVLGLDNDFWNANPSDDQICQALAGKRFIGTVKKSTYQGKERNEIGGVATPRPQVAGAGPAVPGAYPSPMPTAGAPTPPVPQAAAAAPSPVPQAAAVPPVAAAQPQAPAAPASPWEQGQAAPEAGDPWATSAPPAPPVPGA